MEHVIHHSFFQVCIILNNVFYRSRLYKKQIIITQFSHRKHYLYIHDILDAEELGNFISNDIICAESTTEKYGFSFMNSRIEIRDLSQVLCYR